MGGSRRHSEERVWWKDGKTTPECSYRATREAWGGGVLRKSSWASDLCSLIGWIRKKGETEVGRRTFTETRHLGKGFEGRWIHDPSPKRRDKISKEERWSRDRKDQGQGRMTVPMVRLWEWPSRSVLTLALIRQRGEEGQRVKNKELAWRWETALGQHPLLAVQPSPSITTWGCSGCSQGAGVHPVEGTDHQG